MFEVRELSLQIRAGGLLRLSEVRELSLQILVMYFCHCEQYMAAVAQASVCDIVFVADRFYVVLLSAIKLNALSVVACDSE